MRILFERAAATFGLAGAGLAIGLYLLGAPDGLAIGVAIPFIVLAVVLHPDV